MENKKHPHTDKSDEIEAEAQDTGIEDSNSKEPQTDQANEFSTLKAELKEKTKQSEEYFGKLQRIAAEFENYKKRTIREKEAITSDTICEVFSSFLPVIDSFEKALDSAENKQNIHAIQEGIELIHKQLKTILKKFGLKEIKCVGEKFDPEFHNAVMHIEDDNSGEGVIVEELQKGYLLQDKVVRHSVVKVAN